MACFKRSRHYTKSGMVPLQVSRVYKLYILCTILTILFMNSLTLSYYSEPAIMFVISTMYFPVFQFANNDHWNNYFPPRRWKTVRLFGERMQQGVLKYKWSLQAHPNALHRKAVRVSSGKLSEKVHGPKLVEKTR